MNNRVNQETAVQRRFFGSLSTMYQLEIYVYRLSVTMNVSTPPPATHTFQSLAVYNPEQDYVYQLQSSLYVTST